MAPATVVPPEDPWSAVGDVRFKRPLLEAAGLCDRFVGAIRVKAHTPNPYPFPIWGITVLTDVSRFEGSFTAQQR